ncbi:MAG: hypothetical protein AMXMBFR58_07660 [Phycisphaerae bacterium]
MKLAGLARLALALGAVVACVAVALGRPQPQVPAEITHRFERDHLKIGLAEPSVVRGMLVAGESGIDGFAKQVVEEAARAAGFTVEFVEIPVGSGYDELMRGEVDAIAPMSVSEERLATVVYTGPLLVTRGVAYTRRAETEPATIERLRESKVAVSTAGVAHQWCVEQNIPCIPKGKLRTAFEAVISGEADYIVTTQLAGRVEIADAGFRGMTELPLEDDRLWRSFAIACRLQDASLVADLDSGLALLRDSGRYAQIYDRWLAALQPRQVEARFTPTEIAVVAGAIGFIALAGMGAYAVSQRRLAQRTAALQVSEARFKLLFEESPDGVMILDPAALEPVELNASMAALLGRPREEIVGLKVEHWCAQWNDPRHQEDVKRTLETGAGDYDTKVIGAGGKVIDVRCRVRTVTLGGRPMMQAVFRDITESKRAREAVERERRLFVSGPVVCFRSRQDGERLVIEHVSENISQFGYTADDLLSGRVKYLDLVHPEDLPRIQAEVRRQVSSTQTHVFQEYRIRTADGRWVWLADYTTIVRDASGAATHFEGYVIDATRQRESADAIRESEARYRAIVENTPALVFSYLIPRTGTGPQLRVVNSQQARWRETFPWLQVGRDYKETIRPYIHPDDVEAYDAEVERARRELDRFEIEFRLRSRSGEYRSLHSLGIAMPSSEGVQWQCMLVDVTELRRASESARRSEERYREIFSRSHDAIVIFRPEDELILDANERALKLYGYSRCEFVGKSFSMVSFQNDRSRAAIEATLREGVFSDSSWRQRCRDGSIVHVDVVSSVIEYDGQPAIVSFNRDVTGRLKAESALSESELRYRSFVQHSSEGVWCIDFPISAPVTLPVEEQIRLFYQHGVIAECNDAMARMYGLDRADQLIGRRLCDMLPASDPHNVEYLRAVIQNGYRIEDAESHERDVHGEPKFFLNSVMCVIEDGRVVRAWGVQRDITAKKKADLELQEARRRLGIVVQSADLGTWTLDLKTNLTQGDARYLSFFGLGDWSGPVPSEHLRRLIHPDDRPRVIEGLRDAASGDDVYRAEYRVVLADGRTRWISSRGALWRDEQGTPVSIAGASMDVTEAKEAAEERERLAEQLRQAQKLESLGVMAGGIAHDFNNLLVAIMGNAALALKQLPAESAAQRSLSRIEQAAARASELTRQLLAYAGRDQAEPEPIDLAAVVREMVEIVEVSIDRSASVTVELCDGLPTIFADPTQTRQVVMNLLSNASEALEGKAGHIHVRTFRATLREAELAQLHTQGCAEPGEFVCLEVRDTGCGMDGAVKARIFEPFFTTKFTGRGLGLTAVLGIVRRHGGAIGIDSQVGRGTTFRVYLPVSKHKHHHAAAPPPPPAAPETPRSGTILVIDDEAMVRDVAKMCLEDAGFHVVAIPDGPQAITFAQDDASQFDGVLLDMTMPSMSGPEVFVELRKLRGNVPVLLTSGYAEENAAEQLLAEPKVGFIQKPYRPVQLVKAMQDLIAAGEEVAR